MTKNQRCAGILLHPTSLPGPYGIGDLGLEAYKWIDFLHSSGMGLWQILPLGPTGYGDSPYQCFSAFAGNPYLVSPDLLLKEKLITAEDLQDKPDFPEGSVDYGQVIKWKLMLLQRAFDHFSGRHELSDQFTQFQEIHRAWLDDFSLFMALKDLHQLQAWVHWEPAYRSRKEKTLEQVRIEHKATIKKYAFSQFVFSRQWQALKEYAAQSGVRIIGDVPIYVAHDSADVWAHPELFYLDNAGNPTVVAGVPPDYFTETGQLWGNPIYRWEVHAKSGYGWWIARMRMVLSMVDIVRMDHFRGFAGYWEVPADHDTAKDGRWVKGPGPDLFKSLKQALGYLPIIAEDLGVITPDVEALRDQFGLPGMKILQFAFDGAADHPYLPDNYPENTVAYTGTHDNETAAAWYENTSEENRHHARVYLNSDGSNIAWDMIQALWASPAEMVVAPLQDFLGLGDEGRMNTPGKIDGNWRWRMFGEDIFQSLQQQLLDINRKYQRSNK